MDIIAINVGIVVIVYGLMELVKKLFLKTDRKRSLLPVIAIITGAVLAIILYILYPTGLPTCNSVIDAIGIGGMSGASSVGYNQIYKQYLKFTNVIRSDYDDDEGADA